MTCSELKSHLVDYTLGELSPELEIRVNEHLAVCKKCSVLLKQIGDTVSGFEGSARFKPTPGVYTRIAEKITVLKPEPSRFLGMPKSMVFAFGAFMLGIVLTKSIDAIIISTRRVSGIEVRQEAPRRVPFSDTVEFYSVPAKNLARI